MAQGSAASTPSADLNELNDLAASPAHEKSRRMWRQRLIERLEGRAEGYSDGQMLLPIA